MGHRSAHMNDYKAVGKDNRIGTPWQWQSKVEQICVHN